MEANLRLTKSPPPQPPASSAPDGEPRQYRKWKNQREFLMCCIAMSVGLGNVWRFPFAAYDNGGGAFLVPYILVLFFVGKPIYFIEMIVGQFSSRGNIKAYDLCPALRGVGAGQVMAVTCVMTYYSSLLGIITYFLIGSFFPTLPWSVCEPDWPDCFSPSDSVKGSGNKSSAEYYFKKTVLMQLNNIDSGIGVPGWKLMLCLLFVWLCIGLTLLRGVKGTGKFSYFFALFPYAILLILLIRAVTLTGAGKGIMYFIKPQFESILDPKVWYAAVTQCFFSLAVSFGNVLVFSSYNDFRHNIYRDVLIITSLDTITSLIAGFTVFGILGNLSHSLNVPVNKVVRDGVELAFVTYPMAILIFSDIPQIFSVLFFIMMFVLALGCNVAMASSVISAVKDRFHSIPDWLVALTITIFGFFVSLVYITPGGQFILVLVDHHGVSVIIFALAIAELAVFVWIYGIRNIADDAEFMLSRKIGIFWRLCWVIVTPLTLIVIFIYFFASLNPLKFSGSPYPNSAIVCGWLLSLIGFMQVPLYAVYAYYKQKDKPDTAERIRVIFRPLEEWGPIDGATRKEWLQYKVDKQTERDGREGLSRGRKIFNSLFGY